MKSFEDTGFRNKCETCGYKFAPKNDLKTHMNTEHGMASEFYCAKCGKILTSEINLRKHMNKEHGRIFRFECVYCGKILKMRSDVRRHARWKQIWAKYESWDLKGKQYAEDNWFPRQGNKNERLVKEYLNNFGGNYLNISEKLR